MIVSSLVFSCHYPKSWLYRDFEQLPIDRPPPGFSYTSSLIISNLCSFASKNIKSTTKDKRVQGFQRSRQIDLSHSFLVGPPRVYRNSVFLLFQHNILGVTGSTGHTLQDLTVAFCGYTQTRWVGLSGGFTIFGVSLSIFQIQLVYKYSCPIDEDLMFKSLFVFIQFFVDHLGIRCRNEYLLPFELSHFMKFTIIPTISLIATKRISLLPQKTDLRLPQSKGDLLLSSQILKTSISR